MTTPPNDADKELREQTKDDLIEMAIGPVRSGSVKGRHVTGVFDVPILADYIMQLIQAERTRAVQSALSKHVLAGMPELTVRQQEYITKVLAGMSTPTYACQSYYEDGQVKDCSCGKCGARG